MGNLTIGDLVNIWTYPRRIEQGVYPAKITGIIDEDSLGEGNGGIIEGLIIGTGGVFSRPLRDYEPIPLTDYILADNGFERMNRHCMVKRWGKVNGKCTYRILVDKDYDNVTMYVRIRCPYVSLAKPITSVHEFQEALRVCGFEEMADKFTVPIPQK